jgi:hypothetical protein
MKKQRIIAGAATAIVALTLCVAVCLQWSKQGCGSFSLIAGCAYYCACIAGIWGVVDATIKERSDR